MSRLDLWENVVKYNDDHGPRVRRGRVIFSEQIIHQIASHIHQNTTLLHDVDYNADQIKMIGRDLADALLLLANADNQ